MTTRRIFSLLTLLVIAAALFMGVVRISRARKQAKDLGGFNVAVESVRLVSTTVGDYDEKGPGGRAVYTFRNVSEKPIASLRFKQTDTGEVELKTFPDLFQPNTVETYTLPFGPSGHFVVLSGVVFADGTTDGEK